MITGIAVGGFGAGALVTAPVATRLIQTVGVLETFAYLGVAYLILTVISGSFMQNPPADWKLEGWTPRAARSPRTVSKDYTLSEALSTWQWWALWLLLFLNTSAGISVISQEAPLFQRLALATAAAAAGMVGVASIGNALGRMFWAWISDSITRSMTFIVMFYTSCPVLDSTWPSLGEWPHCRDLRDPDVLRRWIRYDACFHCGLVRIEECRADLRFDANSLGLRKRLWAAPDCAYAAGKWSLPRGAPHCGRDHGDVCVVAAFDFHAEQSCKSIRWVKKRRSNTPSRHYTTTCILNA